MDEIRGLRHFIDIATLGSFTGAAERLGLSTSALSKSVAGLEKQLSLRLFVRTTRAVHLTPEGQALFEQLAPAIAHISATLREVGENSTAPTGLVRLSTVTSYGKTSVLPLLPELFERYPGLRLAVSFHDGGRGRSRQAHDVRINWGEERETDKVAQVLCKLGLVLVASPAYLARHGTPTTPAQLTEHECISVALPNRTHVRWIFARRGAGAAAERFSFEPCGRLQVLDELDAVVCAARHGLGVTVSWAGNVQDGLRDGTLVRLLEDYDILGPDQIHSEIVMQYPASKYLRPRVRVVVDFLAQRLRSEEAD